jgi:N-acetylglucosamine-6-phosphate deacetylase
MTSLSIRGGVVHEASERVETDVVVEGSRIATVGEPVSDHAPHVVDATGCSVLPGFVDLQVNGAVGVDLTTQPERIGEVAAFLVQCGVTSFMPTVISSSASDMNAAIAAIGRWSDEAETGARSLGIHLEGPFLNPARAGAHPVHHLRLPSPAEVQGWTRGGGIAMVTIAPELPQALSTIELLVANDVTVCAGHTAATPSDMRAAVTAGARGVTHLFNAMTPMSARVPGAAGATLADSELIAGLIVDGIHVDPVMVRLAWHALGPARIALVTDAISALGLPNGAYSIGDTAVEVDNSGARTTGGVLAGSVLRFDDAVRNLIAFVGCELAEASLSASSTPARLAGRHDLGRLSPGCLADIVVLDEDNRVVVTVVGGRVVFDPQHRCVAS